MAKKEEAKAIKQNKIKLSDLNPVPYNPRNITDEALEKLKASIKLHTKTIAEDERGEGYRLTTTITINRRGNRVVGGHQRIKALKSLGQDWIDEKDITWVDVEPDGVEEKALNYSLNDASAQGVFDEGMVQEMMSEIKEKNEELFKGLDFSDDFMKKMAEEAGGKTSKQNIEAKNPDHVWILIGCPLKEYVEISELVAKLEASKTEGTVIVKTSK